MNTPEIITCHNKNVLTSHQLADFYNCETVAIRKNFNRNQERYQEGKHFFALQGIEKREFIDQYQIGTGYLNVETLYLWTEKGAFLHAKSLNTDKAWDVYEFLIEKYYNNKEELLTIDQAAYMYGLLDMFQFISNQRIVEKQHSVKYVKELRIRTNKPESTLYKFFHNWRNTQLDIHPDDVNERLKEYLSLHGGSPKLMNKPKYAKIFVMDNYESLKNAVWDFMHTQNEARLAQKISDLAYRLAKRRAIPIHNINETTLFQRRKNISTSQKLLIN